MEMKMTYFSAAADFSIECNQRQFFGDVPDPKRRLNVQVFY